ncbi:MAG: hypothetical protein RIG84_20655 [Roseovarius sp.]
MTDGPLLAALGLAALAGLSIPLGGFLARIESVWPGWTTAEARHTVIAFGGGALLAAVALVLVPDGVESLPGPPALLAFMAGGVVFFLCDRALERRGGHASQFMAMVLDYLPEAMALGALLAADPRKAVLLAVLIALQNLPESFNAYREIEEAPKAPSPGRVMVVLCAMVLLGPLAAAVGAVWLTEAPAILGAIMLFAGGGIIYLMFQDVAPQVQLENRWGPPLGAVAGFGLGLAGHLMLHG